MIGVSERYTCTRLLASVSLAAIMLATMSDPAKAQQTPLTQAQSAATPDTSTSIEEVTVTARKRSEKLLDVPIAVTAFSARAIEAQGITSLVDLAAATPGLTADSTVGGSARNDRSFTEYIIRGMVPSSNQNPTTTVFINGVAIPSARIEGIDDVDRVEVLKGPQSAYFGRETFAGAINVVTRDPGNDFAGTVSGLLGSRNYRDFRGSVEGPIIDDMLSFRASFRSYARDGSYGNQAAPGDKASPDETLGDQSTTSGTFELLAKPIDNLKIKAFGMMFNDDDGPSAQGQILPSQANCYGTYYCGTAPRLLAVSPSANTIVDSYIKNFLNNASGMESNLLSPSDTVNHYGLNRDAYHLSLGVDYFVEPLGFTISSLTGGDKQTYSSLQDLDNLDTAKVPNFYFGLPFAAGDQPYYNWPFLVEQRNRDFSQELRFTSDQGQRFRWLVGASYAWSRLEQSLSGGGPFGISSYPAGANEATTIGAFYGLAYDILPDLTLNFEGRYQLDKLIAYNIDSTVNAKGYYHNYLPRAILQYKITPDIMTYATYSQGVNPGTFNTGLESLTPADRQNASEVYGANVVVKPENLENYEIGVKGKFFGGKATLSADVYYDIWTNQIVGAQVVYVEGGAVNLQSPYINIGKTTLRGIEIDGTLAPIEHVLIDASGAINDSRINNYNCVTCQQITGSAYVNGNQLPNVSRYQTHLGIQYSDELDLLPDATWFARLDYNYKSGSYDLAADLAKTPPSNIVNLKAGVTVGPVRVEAFIDNVTNEDAYTNIIPDYLLASPSETFAKPDTLIAGLPNLRTYGIKATYRFAAPESEPVVPTPTPMPPAPPAPASEAPPAPVPEAQRAFQVFFDFDKSDIKSDAVSVIAQAAEAVKAGHQTQINVTGHTDTVGSVGYNLKLSIRRAEAVKKQLIADGVSAEEIATSGVGKTGLLVPTPDGVREPQNRRAEIVPH